MLAGTPVEPSMTAVHSRSTPCTAAVQTSEMRLDLKLTPPDIRHPTGTLHSGGAYTAPISQHKTIGARPRARQTAAPDSRGRRGRQEGQDDRTENEGQGMRAKRTEDITPVQGQQERQTSPACGRGEGQCGVESRRGGAGRAWPSTARLALARLSHTCIETKGGGRTDMSVVHGAGHAPRGAETARQRRVVR